MSSIFSAIVRAMLTVKVSAIKLYLLYTARSRISYARDRPFQALNPANTIVDIHIMATTVHTLNRSDDCPSVSFSDP
jgi:hypothetical protein